MRTLAVFAATVVLGAGAAPAASAAASPDHTAALAEAVRWADTRRGEVSIALIDERGRLLAHRGRR